ncbi:hypothetical protein AB0M36_08905 [Actinoplanes sp. NPDC051346]|uniref:hypothetical protein n=1 Tax=Actinoplanes sp. NPDC051346 TaxID=3155048 RepID=UPI003421B110
MLARALRCLMAAAISAPLLWQPGSAQPPGDTDAYAFMSRRSGHDLVARWNPCEGINYRVNLDHAPEGSLIEIKIAVARMARATGLTFRYAGTTGVVPGNPGNYPLGTQLIIAWAVPGKDTDSLSTDADVAGIGGASYKPGFTESGNDALIIDKGMVLLDATRTSTMTRGFGAARGATTGQLLLHELGHAVGLAHPLINDPNEIMYSQLTAKAADWGAGDLTGLHAVGAAGGCLHADASLLKR